jgi:acyl-CoA dehydrogenase
VKSADFTIVMALTDPTKGARWDHRVFFVENGTPGFIIGREIPMPRARAPTRWCSMTRTKTGARQGRRWLRSDAVFASRAAAEMGAWCVGMARRALDMMSAHAKLRVTFGALPADRRRSSGGLPMATKIHACR